VRRFIGVLVLFAVVGTFVFRPMQVVAETAYADVREGFVFGIGLGWGNAGASLNVVEKVDRQNGFAGDLLLGWAVRNNIVTGFEFDVWSQVFEDNRWVFNLSSVSVSYFPVDGLFFTAGLGLGTSRVEFVGSGGENVVQDQAGVGASVAGGYEFRILEQVALAPKVKWAYLNINGDLTNYVDYLTVTIQLTWYKPKE